MSLKPAHSACNALENAQAKHALDAGYRTGGRQQDHPRGEAAWAPSVSLIVTNVDETLTRLSQIGHHLLQVTFLCAGSHFLEKKMFAEFFQNSVTREPDGLVLKTPKWGPDEVAR